MNEKECEFYKPNLCGIPYSCKSPSWYNCKIVDAGRKLYVQTVLKEHLKAHIKVSRDQLKDVNQMTVFVDFDDSIEKQLAMLNSLKGVRTVITEEEMVSVNRKELEGVFKALEGEKIGYHIIKNVLEPFYKKYLVK